MEKLLSFDSQGQFIQTLGAVLIAIITYIIGPIVTAWVKSLQTRYDKSKKPIRPQEKQSNKFTYAIVSGVAASLTFILFGNLYDSLAPKPIVEITFPSQKIVLNMSQEGTGSFSISGTSSRVSSNLSIYVLLHPQEPFASGWWIQQPATIAPNGQWSTVAYYGSKDHLPQMGNKVEILAVVVNSESLEGKHIINIEDIVPISTSDLIGFEIDKIK